MSQYKMQLNYDFRYPITYKELVLSVTLKDTPSMGWDLIMSVSGSQYDAYPVEVQGQRSFHYSMEET